MLRGRELKPPPRAVRAKSGVSSDTQSDQTKSLPRIGVPKGKPALRFPVSPETRAFYRRFYPGTTTAEWNDWHWQFQARIRTLGELTRIFQLSADEHAAVSQHTKVRSRSASRRIMRA